MTTTTKRIPKGTRVRWRARYPSDPVHEGEVLAFVDRRAHCGNRRVHDREALTRRETWGVLR